MFKTIKALAIGAAIFTAQIAFADWTPQSLPFTQNWSNIGMITTTDDWSGVPGITGYLGQGLTTATGVDPQTVLTTSTLAADLDVIANQTTPDTLGSGGVAEFEITDPCVALNGSGTADAPFIIISLNTAGLSSIRVRYNVRDLDGSADNAIQQVALQYRTGTAGDFTNVASGFVPDATTQNAATQVTAVDATLPSDADNQPVLQVRVITSNAVGNDEWVGIDDINITGIVSADNPNLVVTGAEVFGPIPSSQTQDKAIVITNSGASAQLTVANTTAISGTNASNFTILSSLPLNIPFGTSQTLNVRFNPSGVRGSFSASLDLVTNDPTTPNVSVALSATTTDDPNISAPFTFDFGTISNNTTKDGVIVISNTGAGNVLNVTAATLSGVNAGKFTVLTATPLAINPLSTAGLTVRFNPAGVSGLTTATLALASNDQSNASINVRLNATATTPIISGYDYLNPAVSIFATNAMMTGAAGVSGTFMAASIGFDSDGSLVAFLEETGITGSSSQAGTAGALLDIAADGQSATVIATEAQITAALPDNAASGDINPNGLGVGTDGTVYMSEFGGTNNEVFKVARGPLAVTPLADATGISSMAVDNTNNRVLLARASGLPGGTVDEISAVAFAGGAPTTVVSEAAFIALSGGTGFGLGIAIVDPTNPANLIVYDEAAFGGGGTDSVIRINNYNSGGFTLNTLFPTSAFPTAPGFSPFVSAGDGTLFGYERNASGGSAQVRLTIMAPTGQVYTIPVDTLDTLFGYSGSNASEADRDVYARNGGMLAARVEGNDLALYIASATGPRHIFKMTFPAIIPVNKARNWNIFE